MQIDEWINEEQDHYLLLTGRPHRAGWVACLARRAAPGREITCAAGRTDVQCRTPPHGAAPL
jgi:hypothetical protein